MVEIDFEEIRVATLSEVTQQFQENAYGDSLRLYADLSSRVTKLMIEKYHQQLQKDD